MLKTASAMLFLASLVFFLPHFLAQQEAQSIRRRHGFVQLVALARGSPSACLL